MIDPSEWCKTLSCAFLSNKPASVQFALQTLSMHHFPIPLPKCTESELQKFLFRNVSLFFFLLLFNHLATKDLLSLLFVWLLFECFSRALHHSMHPCPFCRADETYTQTMIRYMEKKYTFWTMLLLRIIENCFGCVMKQRQRRTLFENDHSKFPVDRKSNVLYFHSM